jgi:flavin-dependent dehydrogenase
VTAEYTCCPLEEKNRRIVIVGGGYAGTTLAVRLGRALKRHPRPDVGVLLVERDPCQQALSELDRGEPARGLLRVVVARSAQEPPGENVFQPCRVD